MKDCDPSIFRETEKQKLQGFIWKLKKVALNNANFSMHKLHKLPWKQLFHCEKWDHYYFRYKIKLAICSWKCGRKEYELLFLTGKCGIKECEFGQYWHSLIPHFFLLHSFLLESFLLLRYHCNIYRGFPSLTGSVASFILFLTVFLLEIMRNILHYEVIQIVEQLLQHPPF